MHFRKFDLNLLVVLEALLNERNVTRAAQLLCVTQPPVSNALMRIRQHFDDQILVRHGRDMELTPLAKSLVAPVRELMLQTGHLLDADYQFDPMKAERSFRIAMSDYCATILMGPLMEILSLEAPGLRCEVTTLSERTVAMLIGGEFDMCLTAQDLRLLDNDVDPSQLGRATLFSDDFICAVDAANPRVGNTLDLAAYLELPHAITRFGNGTISIEERALQRLDLDLKIVAVAPTFASLVTLLEGTPLVIALQRRLAARLSHSAKMRMFEPPIEIPALEETLYWHRRSEQDKAHIWFRTALLRTAAMLPSHLAAGAERGDPWFPA